MFKVVVTSLVLSILIASSGLYSCSLPMAEFMDISDLYHQQKLSGVPVQEQVIGQYKALLQQICGMVSEDSYHTLFDELFAHSSQVTYSRRVLLGELCRVLDETILQQLHQADLNDTELKRFLMQRHQQIQQWQSDNISGNDLYFHRIRICNTLVGTRIFYKNVAGQELVFTIHKAHIREVEKVQYAGQECLQVIISDGHLRWCTYYRVKDLECVETIPDFNS